MDYELTNSKMLKSVLFDEKNENFPVDLQTPKMVEKLNFFQTDLENRPDNVTTPNLPNFESNQQTIDNGIDPIVDPIPLMDGILLFIYHRT